MQLHLLLASTLLTLTTAAPLNLSPRACSVQTTTDLATALQSRSFDQLNTALEGHSSSEIMLDLAATIRERSVDAVVEDFKAAIKDHPPQKQKPHQRRGAQYCGGYPFYGIAGYDCGVSTLLYGLSGYNYGLLSGLGFVVDGIGAGLGLGGIL